MVQRLHIGINSLASSFQRTGSGTYINKIIEHLSYIDSQNLYSIFINKNNQQQFIKIGAGNFKKVDTGLFTRIRPTRILWEQFVLPECLVRRGIDILHSPVFISPLRLKCKSVITVLDMTFFKLPEKHTFIKQLYFSRLIPLSARRADKIIAISESVKKDMVELLGTKPDKIEVIYLASGENFKPVNDPVLLQGVRDKYNIKGGFILFAGVLEPRKNLATLIKAFSRLKKEKKIEEKLVIVGKKGWGYSSVFSLIEELGLSNEVILTGYVPEEDLVLLYNAAKVFIYPSLYEGFGLPVLEAMACGVPVITSRNSSLEEIAAEAAILIEPLSQQDMVETCYGLLQDDSRRERLAQAGLARARQFSWRDSAWKTLEAYRSLY